MSNFMANLFATLVCISIALIVGGIAVGITSSIYFGIENVAYNKAHGCAPLADNCSVNVVVNHE